MHDWKNRIKYYNDHELEMGNIWSCENYLHLITDDFLNLIKAYDFNAIATIEAKGIIFASAIADRLSLPLYIFRKRGKIRHTREIAYKEFTNWRNESDGIEIETENILGELNFLVIDDLADQLNTFNAVYSILKQLDKDISAFLCFANISGKKELNGIDILSLVETK